MLIFLKAVYSVFMFVRLVKKPNDHVSIRIVENQRVKERSHGKIKVQQKTVCCIGHTHKNNTEKIKQLEEIGNDIIIKIKNDKNPTFKGLEWMHAPKKRKIPDNMVCVEGLEEKARIEQGVEDVFGATFDELELNDLICTGYKRSEFNKLLKEIVLARLSFPESKRKTVKDIQKYKSREFDLDKVYRMMDKVHTNKKKIKSKIARRTLSFLKEKIHVAFFDVTTLYFEAFDPDELRVSGYSKDNRIKEIQVVLALMTTTEGLPIGYELFPGNTYEGHTLIKVIEQIEETYDIVDLSIVADRAMFTEANLSQLEKKNSQFIVAAKLKGMKKGIKEQILKDVQGACSQSPNLRRWSQSYEYEGRKLIVSYNKDRAMRDEKSRKDLLDRLKAQMKDEKVLLSHLIKNTGTKKYLKIDKKNPQEATINEEKVKKEAQWDGLHGVITNHSDLSIKEVLGRYKDLWQIEAAFRINKHDLRMRPVYHFRPRRVKAHILICYIAYSLVAFVKYKLKQKHINVSFERLKEELRAIQQSLITDKITEKEFILPSKLTASQKAIYDALNLKRCQIAKIIKIPSKKPPPS